MATLREVRERTIEGEPGHLQCPFCGCYVVSRLFVGAVNLDSCECADCGARWDEQKGSGNFCGRSAPSSYLVRLRPDAP